MKIWIFQIEWIILKNDFVINAFFFVFILNKFWNIFDNLFLYQYLIRTFITNIYTCVYILYILYIYYAYAFYKLGCNYLM